MNRRIKFGVFAFLLLGVVATCGVMIGRELLCALPEKTDTKEAKKTE